MTKTAYRAWLSIDSTVLTNRDGFAEVDIHQVLPNGDMGELALSLTLAVRTDSGDHRAIIDAAEAALTDADWLISGVDVDKPETVEGWSPTQTGYTVDVWMAENTTQSTAPVRRRSTDGRARYYDRLLSEELGVALVERYRTIEDLDTHFNSGGYWTFHLANGGGAPYEHTPTNWATVRARALEVAAKIEDDTALDNIPDFPHPGDTD